MIEKSSMHRIALNYANPQLVVRVECESLVSSQVPVLISPPPFFTNNGIAKVAITDLARGTGEYLVKQHRCDRCEIQLQHSAGERCSLANSYLVLCALDQHSVCEVRVVDEQRQLLECDCSNSTPNYLHLIFCLVVLLLLIILCEFY